MVTAASAPLDVGVVALLGGVALATAGGCTLSLAHELVPRLLGAAALLGAMAIALAGAVITLLAGSLWCVPLLAAAVVLLLAAWSALD